ncbi:2-hydroxycarboxylate transporter family protein [Romboutsia sp. 1001713B170207_170306_H8]|uniref:2-hydroxycarboxylate transporter family protein n=1 Tax=Romboutsia sp. 1001713B170207_170306_H8 TaxID=2787112 RepID=UPI0018981B58|nr:2-hydroxycarboxylate transporter family protein [Romboutsia sp. 1001713B170207_170306_H8]
MQGAIGNNNDVVKKQGIEIYGMSLLSFALVSLVVLIATFTDNLPSGMVGALAIMIVLGGAFNEIGNRTPIVKTYLGGGAIVCIFASAAMVTFNIMPTSVVENVDFFMNDVGFLNFYIAALITGSILGMNRQLLIKASVRFLPVAICAITFALILVGIVGSVVGYGFKEAIMFVAIPMMGGGMGAGVIPLSNMYSQALGTETSQLLSVMIPASTLGNVMAIIGAGIIAKIGTVKPSWSGNGKLMKNDSSDLDEKKSNKLNLKMLGIGLLLSITYLTLGTLIGKLVPGIHAYAWMIIAVAFSKIIGIIPENLEQSANQWGQFVMTNLTSALLVGIGISMIDLNAVVNAISPLYLLLVFVVVSGVAVGAGVGGKLVGFYPIESSITAGLCTTNMGGTGDVAVLSASNRMELIPFAQIATRICGALILIVASVLLKVLM